MRWESRRQPALPSRTVDDGAVVGACAAVVGDDGYVADGAYVVNGYAGGRQPMNGASDRFASCRFCVL